MRSTTAAVRHALKELGPAANESQVTTYVRSRFPTVPRNHIGLTLQRIRAKRVTGKGTLTESRDVHSTTCPESVLEPPPISGNSWGSEGHVGSIQQGDALEILPRLEEQSVDLTIFSPPYDGIREYGKNWSLDYKTLGDALLRVTKAGGVCAVVIGDGTRNFAKSLTTFRWAVDWVDRAGWRLFETCIYSRHGNPGAWWSQRFRVDHEYILIFFRGKRPRYFDKSTLMVPSKHAGKVYSGTDRLTNGGFKKIDAKAVNDMKCRGTIWEYSTSNTEGNRTKLQHPATFPDRLADDLIQCFSKPGDLVLDPMCGSGTTCVLAAKGKRRYLGIEINPEYHEIAVKRVRNETANDARLF